MYRYKLQWFDEIDDTFYDQKGVCAAASYEEAVHKLIEWYGEFVTITLTKVEDIMEDADLDE